MGNQRMTEVNSNREAFGEASLAEVREPETMSLTRMNRVERNRHAHRWAPGQIFEPELDPKRFNLAKSSLAHAEPNGQSGGVSGCDRPWSRLIEEHKLSAVHFDGKPELVVQGIAHL